MTKNLLAWLLANLVGITLFLLVASQIWIEPEVADVPGASVGDAFVWMLEAAPILGTFLLANIIWLLMSGGRGRWVAVWVILAILGCWAAAWLIDNAHHGI